MTDDHAYKLKVATDVVANEMDKGHLHPGVLTSLAVNAYENAERPKATMVTDEMVEAARSRIKETGGWMSEEMITRILTATLPLSPIIKRAREWRDVYAGEDLVAIFDASARVRDALKDAGL